MSNRQLSTAIYKPIELTYIRIGGNIFGSGVEEFVCVAGCGSIDGENHS